MPLANVRQYTDADMPQLQAALAAWINTAGDCGYCHTGDLPHLIYTPNAAAPDAAERVQVWEDASGIVGFALNLLFDHAFAVFTSPAFRGTSTERQMIQAAVEQTRALMYQTDRPPPDVITDVWDCDSTRMQQLQQLGFGKYRVWTFLTERDLAISIPEPRLPPGYAIRAATPDDFTQMAAIRNAAFGDAIDPMTFRDRVMRRPGFDVSHELVVIAPDGPFAAFTHIWLDRLNAVGLFEPVGTHPAYQRKGLARGLMLHGMQLMQNEGMRVAQVAYTVTKTRAARLYRSLGFVRKHTLLGFKNQPRD